MQKIAHTKIMEKNEKLPKDKQISYGKDKAWITGFVIYAIGSVLHGIALSMGPQSLLTPLESKFMLFQIYQCMCLN